MALEDGFEPPTRTPSTCRSTSELLQHLDPTPGIEPGRRSSADRRLPTWPGRGRLAPGEGLEPPFRGSEPRVLPLDHPGVLRYGALDGDRTRHLLLDRQSSPPGDHEGAMKTAWWWCAGEDSHPHSRWPRGYNPLSSLVPEPARFPPRVFGLPCLFGFQSAGPGLSGQKERGLASPGPLLTPCLVVGVPVAPTEETPGPVTLDWVPVKGRCVSLPAIAA